MFPTASKYRLSFAGRERVLIQLPRPVTGLRLDPLNCGKGFAFPELTARERSGAGVLLPALRRELGREGGAGALCRLWRRHGRLVLKHRLLRYDFSRADYERCYQLWIGRYDAPSPGECGALRERAEAFRSPPLISVLMPVYNTPERFLREAIDSVRGQLYGRWDLCICDDASSRPHVARVLEEYRRHDPRVRVMRRAENGHISAASNYALAMARGEYAALMDHDDMLSPDAPFRVAAKIDRFPETDLIYSDEDRICAEGVRRSPYFKPDWNAELMLGQNLVSHLGVYRTEIARRIGGFREGFEGSQDWDFALRFTEQIPSARICHVPRVLYHWRDVPGTVSFTVDTQGRAFEAARRSVAEALARSAAFRRGWRR